MVNEYGTPRRVGLDTAGHRGGTGGDSQRPEALQGAWRERSRIIVGGRDIDGNVRDGHQLSNSVLVRADDHWSQFAHSRLDRPLGFDRSRRDTSGDTVRIEDSGQRHKRIAAHPVLVGCLIVLTITVATQFIAGIFI